MALVSAIAAPVAGFIMDKFGLFVGMYMATSAAFLGQLLICIAAYTGSYNCMLVGRFTFGFGYEPINTVKNIIIAKWFIGGELSFSSNLNLAISRMFVFANGYSTPLIAEQYNYTAAFIFGLGFTIVSLLSTIPITIL